MELLPEKFKFSHDYCLYLHDRLAEILVSGERADIFGHEIQVELPVGTTLDDGEAIHNWLEANGYKDEVLFTYYKQMSAALLSDMLHFIYEALECSKKGKLTVAFSLLRKPLKENLFYLEWLLADVGEMIYRFDLGDVKLLSLGSRLSEEQKIEIISKAIEQTDYAFLDAELIYRLRYDKKAPLSFEPLFQKATHLITTFDYLETEAQNFNFIFSGEDALQSQWEFLYDFLPILLFHAYYVVNSLVLTFSRRESEIDLTDLRNLIGLAFWMKDSTLNFDYQLILDSIRESVMDVGLKCEHCSSPLLIDEAQFMKLYTEYRINCGECNWEADLLNLTSSSNDATYTGQ